jgi:TPR repeat protein
MAFNPIETAPKNEELIILHGESSDGYEVARWSVEKSNWVREEGEPIGLIPTHWMQLPNASSVPFTSNLRGRDEEKALPLRRYGLYASLFVTVGLAVLVTAFIGNFESPSSYQTHRAGETSARTASDPAPTVLSQDVASAEMAILNVRTVSEPPPRIETAKVPNIEQKQGFDQARLRDDAVVHELASGRQDVETLKDPVDRATAAMDAAGSETAQTLQTAQASASEQKDALDKERQRGDALARDLASARAEVEALKAPVAPPIVARTEPTQFMQAAHSSSQAAAPPTTGFAAVSTASVGRGSAADPQTAADTKSSVARGDSAAAPAREPAAVGDRTRGAAPTLGAIEDQIVLWVKRGEDLIAVGDFVSARVLFQRAADVGDAQATLMLAATYDPNMLDRFRVKGLTMDIAKARWWYEKARDLGSPAAARRLELLAQPRG